MVDISFSLEGGEVVHRSLGIVADGVSSYKVPLRQIGSNFTKVFDQNFDSRGSTYGGWAPRKPVVVSGIRLDTWPLMERTGRMRRSFDKTVTDSSLTLTNSAPYFVYHQSRSARRSNLPRRVLMKIRQQDATSIVKEFQYYLVQLLRTAGKR